MINGALQFEELSDSTYHRQPTANHTAEAAFRLASCWGSSPRRNSAQEPPPTDAGRGGRALTTQRDRCAPSCKRAGGPALPTTTHHLPSFVPVVRPPSSSPVRVSRARARARSDSCLSHPTHPRKHGNDPPKQRLRRLLLLQIRQEPRHPTDIHKSRALHRRPRRNPVKACSIRRRDPSLPRQALRPLGRVRAQGAREEQEARRRRTYPRSRSSSPDSGSSPPLHRRRCCGSSRSRPRLAGRWASTSTATTSTAWALSSLTSYPAIARPSSSASWQRGRPSRSRLIAPLDGRLRATRFSCLMSRAGPRNEQSTPPRGAPPISLVSPRRDLALSSRLSASRSAPLLPDEQPQRTARLRPPPGSRPAHHGSRGLDRLPAKTDCIRARTVLRHACRDRIPVKIERIPSHADVRRAHPARVPAEGRGGRRERP